jgi:hypothetical protein
VCYNQQTLVLQGRIPIPQIWAIVEISVSTLALILSSCVFNQHDNYWLFGGALENAFNFYVKLI